MFRLAWFCDFLVFVVAIINWCVGHYAPEILVDVGFGLLIAAVLSSIFARRFSPFAGALLGYILLTSSISL